MAADIGAKVGIDGEKAFRDSLGAINSQLKTMGSEMKSVVSAFAGMEDSEESLAAKSDVLQRSIALSGDKIQALQGQSDRAKTKLSSLADELENAKTQFGENSREALNAQNAYNRQVITVNRLETQIFNTTAEMNRMQTEMSQLNGSAGQLSDGFENTEKKALNFGSIIKGSALAVGAFAVAAGAAAIGLGKEAVAAFADYEQLVGGVDTLFKGSSAELQQYAANAYKTAGMSANDYMETVTSFSASLIQSLGGDTEKAVKYADTAITDMSDNANKMGTDIASIQNAYQGFAKQNYTMLDNLKLGYGGTKEEMKRLLEDAQKISGVKYDISSYADVVDAIHVMQESMGIAGTTALEAEKTISGSISSLQSAVQNLLVGFGDANADMATLTQNFADALKNVITNILPVIENMVSALPEVVAAIMPALEGMLPSLLTTVTQLLKQVVDAIFKSLPQLVPAAVSGVLMIVDTLIDNIPLLISAAFELIKELANGLVKAIPELVPKIVDVVIGIVDTIIENLPMIIGAGIEIIVALAGAIIKAIPTLLKSVPKIISSLVGAFKELLGKMKEIGKNVIEGLWNGIGDKVDWLKGQVSGVVDKIKGWFTEKDGFDTHSPSKWSEKIGGWVMQGLGVGMKKDTTAIAAARNATAKIGDVIKKEIEATSAAIQKMQSDAAKAQAEEEIKQYKESLRKKTEELKKAEKKDRKSILDEIAKLESDWNKKQASAAEKAEQEKLNKRMTALQEFQNEYEAALSQIENKQNSLDDKLAGYGDLFEKSQSEDGKELFELGDIEGEIEKIQKFGEAVDKVKEKGISSDLLAEISNMDIDDALAYMGKLDSLSSAEFDKYITSYQEKQTAANEVAKKFYADEMQSLEADTLNKISSFEGDFIDVGKMLTDGVSSGIENGKSGLIDTITSALRAAVKAAREEMDINSPSGVFEEIGDYMGQGLDVGWISRMKSVTKNIQSSMADITKTPSLSLAGGGNGISKSYSFGDTNVYVGTVNNGNGRDTKILAQELEFERRMQLNATGGQ